MKARLGRWLEAVRESLWVIPIAMVTAAVLLAWAALQAQGRIGQDLAQHAWWLWNGSADGARSVLSTIAGSMITVAGVVFSITIVSLTLASSQFGPRLLADFVRDRINQSVLGTFVATFVYCLLVMRTIRGGSGAGAVPSLAISTGVVLAIASLGVLIFFIHHLAYSIQADTLAARVAGELREAIHAAFPEPARDDGDEDTPTLPAGEPATVASTAAGYVQIIDLDSLVDRAVECDCVVKLLVRAGRFVVAGGPLMQVWPADRLDDRACARLRRSCEIGPRRTPVQDVEFSVHELVEIAVRALSPALNDPFTAMVCLDWLASALAEAGQRRTASTARRDARGCLRVVALEAQFESLAQAAFDQIRQASRGNAVVNLRILDALAQVAPLVRRQRDRAALGRQARLVHEGASALHWEDDRQAVAAQSRRVLALLAG